MKKMLILFMALMLFASFSFAGKLVIENGGDSDNQNTNGGWWYSYNDKSSGGNSVVEPKPGEKFVMTEKGADGKGYCAHIKGTVGNKLGWDFIGMGTTLSKKANCPKIEYEDLSGYKYLKFMAKGKVVGGRLTVVLPYIKPDCGENYSTESYTDWADYEAPITSKINKDWTEIKLELKKDFKQPKWCKEDKKVSIEKVLKNMQSISFHYSSPDGESMELYVDDIVFE